ncbi:Glucooligosaccharide oxidase [Xylaria palmicola]|nr:Glucooligosaccharide oxidase [Xylaria palmicola]
MDASISSRLGSLGIETKTPLDSDWEFYSSTYNTRVPVTPEVVALPATIEQVSQAVVSAAARGLRVQARSGGHSYASHSNGGVDGAMVIDLRKLQDIVLGTDGIVRVGGGVRLGRMASAIFEQGGRAVAHGTCPTVGIGGHFTHGGFGLSSRAWGLSMDQIIAVDAVIADGKVVRASETENKSLFVALRGAADSFGVVVNFYLHTQPAPTNVVKWSVDISEATRSVENATKAFLQIQDFANNASIVDRKLGFLIFLAHQRFTLEGTYLGEMDKFTSAIIPVLLGGLPMRDTIKVNFHQVDWLELLRLLAGGADLKASLSQEEHHAFFAKGTAVSHPGLSQDVMEGYFRYLLRNGTSLPINYFVGVQLYGGADSRITAHTADDSFGHRDAMWMFQHYGSVDGKATFPDEGIRFIEGLNKALGSGHGASSNYADASLETDEALKLYYGHKLETLMKLKGELDPQNVFSHPQSVRKA